MTNIQPRAFLKAKGLGKRVESPAGELVILADIDLEISTGEAVAVVGASGSGKSTLLGLLAGLDTPSSGTVMMEEHDLGALDEDGRAKLRASKVGFVFQSFQLLQNMTALENVMLPLELAGHPDPRPAANELLVRVGLGQRQSHYPKQLSGGEQQRVAIARAFAANPIILFADEPTGNLDQKTGAHICELLFALNREMGTTLVLVTHDPQLADPCDRVVQLDAGRIVNGETG
jgi:putative ABC transport system ATP-binding protein